MNNNMSDPQTAPQVDSVPWYKTMNRYHWFVFVVCSLGWGLDCLDQQIFNIFRNPALAQVLHEDETAEIVAAYAGYATSLMLIGWATGGILFGIMGDKFGRAKTMIFTILIYAVFTGLTGLSTSWWDFFLYRFLTGLGVGGQFAAGVTLLSETMPDKARPHTLGWLQIVAAAGNMLAAILGMIFVVLGESGALGGCPAWRIMFMIGFLPALLAIVVMRYMEEPEKWKKAVAEGGVKKAGSISELFSHPRWRYNVIIGMLLSTCGVIGLWGIGFFSVDLTRTTIRKNANKEYRQQGGVEKDDDFIRMLLLSPEENLKIAATNKVNSLSFLGKDAKTNDHGVVFAVVEKLVKEKTAPIDAAAVLNYLDQPSADGKRKAQTPEERTRRETLLTSMPTSTEAAAFTGLSGEISQRASSVRGAAGWWGSIASLLFNFGAVIGTYIFTLGAERLGRRPMFTIAFAASLFVTVLVFMTLRSQWDVLWMQPLLGFCTLSLFGGYAIYFPELFPTHLRSTAVSFCYNIGRYIAATGPAGLGLLTAYVFCDFDEPFRYAGAAMSLTFVFGIIVTWFGPETKGKPLPE